MTRKTEKSLTAPHRSTSLGLRIATLSLTALALGACKHGEEHTAVAGWSLVEPTQRHPILVSQQPETMSVNVPKGSSGLSPVQRADVLNFARGARASDAGNSRVVISAPSGTSNEVAAMQSVHEIGELLGSAGISETDIVVESYPGDRGSAPAVKVAYLRFVAEGPECGHWPTNLASQRDNLPHPNMGCATQKNLAAMIANPADLVMPRGTTARPAERRLVTWEKYIKGEVTGAEKSEEEKAKTDGE
ncbi:MAG: CpaD family pilus assembly protein [Hyphomicrobium sp.]|nr:CpaD family pilus assembly protein [Hyphomicrobium sp.]